MDVLSADSLAEILSRLPPRGLARSRCVSKAWRAAIDDHRLLRASQLPFSLDGVLYGKQYSSQIPTFFSRRSTARRITSGLQRLDDNRDKNDDWHWPIYDCCNGLLLLYRHVVNPATRQWACLPTPARPWRRGHSRYLVYDPTVSPHYEVFLIPQIQDMLSARHDSWQRYGRFQSTMAPPPPSPTAWPPSTYVIHAFSSTTGRWKDRPLVREGAAAATVDNLIAKSACFLYYSAYWQGSLYVRCEYGCILRINLSNDRYQVIKLPSGGNEVVRRLGKSEKGVYCALLHRGRTCEIWFLDESEGSLMEWVLRNEIDLQSIKTYYLDVNCDDEPWVQRSGGRKEWLIEDNEEELPKDNFAWDSSNGNIVDAANLPRDVHSGSYYFDCLGFHPYKEIVLLRWPNETVAYHFGSSKVRYLGKMTHPCPEVEVSFAYAPCWTTSLPGSSGC